MPEITLRESRPAGHVRVLVDGVEVHKDREYRGAINFTRNRYGLSDLELEALFSDYKEDYDSF